MAEWKLYAGLAAFALLLPWAGFVFFRYLTWSLDRMAELWSIIP